MPWTIFLKTISYLVHPRHGCIQSFLYEIIASSPVSFWHYILEILCITKHIFSSSVFTNTIAIEWDLVCQKQYLANLAQTITMLGILFGNMVFGYLSDR